MSRSSVVFSVSAMVMIALHLQIRARLEREQRLPPPAGGAPGAPTLGGARREHYYSTIDGSDRVYESVDDAPLAARQQLAVDTGTPASSSAAGPPPLPPTSPIPDRNALQAAAAAAAGLSPGRSTGWYGFSDVGIVLVVAVTPLTISY